VLEHRRVRRLQNLERLTVGASKSCRWQPPKVIYRISAANPPNFRHKFHITHPNPRESTSKFPDSPVSAQIPLKSAKNNPESAENPPKCPSGISVAGMPQFLKALPAKFARP